MSDSDLSFYKTFEMSLYLHLCIGFNLLQTSWLVQRFINTVCTGTAVSFHVLFLVISCSSPAVAIANLPCILVSIEYMIAVLATSVANTSIVSQLYGSIDRLDSKLGIGKGDYDKLKFIHDCLAAFLIVKRFLNTLLAYISMPEYFVGHGWNTAFVVLCNWMNLGVGMCQLPRLIYFILMLQRIKVLKLKLERVLQVKSVPCSVILVRGATEEGPHRGVLLIAHLYREIIEDLDTKSKYISPLFMLTLICYLPKMMFIIYQVLLFLKKGSALMFVVVMLVDTVEWAVFPSSSAIVAELISHHVDKIKLTLLHCLRDQKNKEQRSEIDSFLRYLELRPFKYSIWRVVDVDLTLPVALLGLCTTYTIVIIQLTRLYG